MFRQIIKPYFVQSKDKIDFVLLDGGRLQVPDLEHFRDLYNRYRKQEKLYVVERVSSPVFPFFLDIDHGSEKPLLAADRDYLVSVIFDFLRDAHGVESAMVACFSNQPKMKNGKYYDGIHLHWPGLFVNKGMAVELRNQIVENLTDVIGGDWDDIVDEAVYKTGSLRMKGSYKRDDVNRCYWPKYVFDKSVRKPWDPDDDDKAIRLCSVKTEEQEPTTLPSLVIREPETESPKTVAVGTLLIEKDSVAGMLLQRFPEYKGAEDFCIRDVVVFKRSAVIKTSCRYCLNKGGYHNSCTVYFYVHNGDDPCVYQRCFSHKLYNGKQCSKNMGVARFYHGPLFALLFGKK